MAKRFAGVFLSTALILVFSISQAISARADVTISVAPSLVEVAATPGGKGSQDLVVYNDGSDPFEVIASVEQARRSTDNRSAVNWLNVSPNRFEVAPGEQRKVTVSIAVPSELGSGGRYAVVAFATKAKPVGGSSIGVAGQIGVPFLITIGGQGSLTRQATLDWLLPVLETDGRVGFRALLVNRGNLHLVSQGEVEIRRSNGTPAGRLDLPETTPTLPETERVLVAEGTLPMEENIDYRARATIDYGGDALAEAEVSFRARAALSVASLSALENPDRGPTLQLGLSNQGDLGVEPRVRFAVRTAEGKLIAAPVPPQPSLIRPGQQVMIEAQYPGRLSSGEYVLLARIEYGKAEPIQRETTFRIGAPLPAPNPDWGDAPERAITTAQATQGNSWWLLALPAALVIVAIGIAQLPVLVNFRRRVQRAVRVLRGEE